MVIRPATSADYSQVMELYNAFVNDDRYSKHNNDSFKQVIENPDSYLFVAEDGESLCGFASMSVRTVVRYPAPIAELDELYVALDKRQHGVGRELMSRIEAAAKNRDCRKVFVESNYVHEAAHKFYETIGYTNYGYHFIKEF